MGKNSILTRKIFVLMLKKKSNLGLMRKYFILLRKKLLASENCSLSNFFSRNGSILLDKCERCSLDKRL